MEHLIYEVLFYFLIYAFFGWCAEVIFHAVVKGQFINRGFDIGPLCPIYGFGALSVLLFLDPLKEHPIYLFFASVVFTTLIEFTAGFLLERFFNEKWWDYSDEPYNVKGYICPRFSIMWGLACVIVVYVIHPMVAGFVAIIPLTVGYILLSSLYAAFLADLVVTLINVMHIRNSLRAIEDIERSLEKLSYSIGTNLSDSTLAVMDSTEKIKGELDERQAEFKDSLETAMWEHNDARIKKQAQKELADERRRAEYDKRVHDLKRHTAILKRRTRRIGRAFPNLTGGRYERIFKRLADNDTAGSNSK